ncbi:MAG: RNA polymerase sigma-70 factor (ECF subfamily) [Planctomycetota bacterium]|jgi:RNA polymerase sigma-70 factor (ECF subfamily)
MVAYMFGADILGLMSEPSDITLILQKVNDGEVGAGDELFSLVYGELRRVAANLMRGERTEHTLQPTALVHEVWMRLLGSSQGTEQGSSDFNETPGQQWSGRGHFLKAASRSMRNLLVDHARARSAVKRGGGNESVALDDIVAVYEERGIDVVSLSDAMIQLDKVDNQLARMVELRFFGGLANKEVAAVLGISTRTCERGWLTARAFLKRQLGDAV